jgi:hypothetical protein
MSETPSQKSGKIPIDAHAALRWYCASEWKFEYPAAAVNGSAAAQSGSWVLTRSDVFPNPTANPAVGFLFLGKHRAATTKTMP